MLRIIKLILSLTLLLGQVLSYTTINSTIELNNYLADCLGSLFVKYNITHNEYTNMTIIMPYEYRSTNITGLDLQLMACIRQALFPYHVVGFVPNQQYASDVGMYDSVEDDTDVEDDSDVEGRSNGSRVEIVKRISAEGYAFFKSTSCGSDDTPFTLKEGVCSDSKNIKYKSLYVYNPNDCSLAIVTSWPHHTCTKGNEHLFAVGPHGGGCSKYQ